LLQLRLIPWAVGDGRSFNGVQSVVDAESAVAPDGEFQSEYVTRGVGLIERCAHLVTLAADVIIEGISVSHSRGEHGGNGE
jgi:hypothetical protein